MSEMLRSKTWNQKKFGAFFANVFWCNISSGNCFHKHDICKLICMIIYVKKTFEAKQWLKCRKYFKKKPQSQNMCKTSTLFFRFLFGDFNISDIFYKILNLNKWPLVSVITHRTYTCLNPWALYMWFAST